jgi:uncharacterized RDD family membrane protein YckC
MESTGAPGTPPPDEAPVPQEAPPPPAPPAASPPPPAPPPAAASTAPTWVNTITSSQTVAGPGGMVYSDLPMRIVAYIIDAVILGAAFFFLYTIFGSLFLGTLFLTGFGVGAFIWFVVLLAIYAAGSAIYFIYTWTKMRGSIGQRVIGLETVNAADGATLTQPQAIRRYIFLFGPMVLAQALTIVPLLGILGTLLGFVGLVYSLYLLYTAANSPTRQGFHDMQAATAVIKIKK